jgi:hypothetical protein
MGKGKKLPTMSDVRHLMDYIVYRITRSNVGPWGLSKVTERRPLYLSPGLAVAVGVPAGVADSVRATLHRLEDDDDVTSASQDLAHRFPPPDRVDPLAEIGGTLSGRAGRGLFGNSDVWVTETPARVAAAILADSGVRPRTLDLSQSVAAPAATKSDTEEATDE